METAAFGFLFILFFIIFGGLILIAVLYLLNLQNTIKAAAPENRKMPPANVWLLIIPIFNIVYSFIVSRKIADTISAEYASKGQSPDSPNPTYIVGLIMSICSAVNFLISMFSFPSTLAIFSSMSSGNAEEMIYRSQVASSSMMGISMISSLISFTAFILWIVYWVQTSGYKNKMKSLPDNRNDSQIFGQY